ncbi:hypothetical protein DdX_19368 [Ditylenchus destructor]|uniref:Uncharacterized protein n=1 Tax=Ditylenchus destructor TaxID=166010 RepID=A0AAD4MI34_9BILA|nr:hypothetical protein DdX_19368 [Ditylenchus destructor]
MPSAMSKPNIPLEPLVEILSFHNRHKLALFSRMSRFLNQVIQQNFRPKPYMIWQKPGLELCVKLCARKKLRVQLIHKKRRLSYVYDTRTWRNVNDFPSGQDIFYSLDAMRFYLPLFLRIALVRIYISNDMFSTKNIEDLTSLAHVWDGQVMNIEPLYFDKDDPDKNQEARCLILDRILSSPNLIRCRRLIITNPSGILLHSQNHSTLYNLLILQLNAFVYTKNAAEFLLNFILNKVSYPESETLLIVNFDSDVCLGRMPPIQDSDFDLVDQIRKDFTTSVTLNRFCLILNYRYRSYDDFHKISLPLCEFRMENSATNEVLQFVQTRYCERIVIHACF